MKICFLLCECIEKIYEEISIYIIVIKTNILKLLYIYGMTYMYTTSVPTNASSILM